jgi:hypothetical protein
VSGIYLVKVASAAHRITIDVSRTVLIWAFFLSVPSTWNNLRENFDFVQLIGFVIQTLGTFIFNEIVIIPFFGMN